ncbi:energy-coupling factor transporter ATPase [Acetohalobium arabaticum]|uniref:Energy-coupling factor transporter ATP-binding protein EcfA2 n=1 Tax=Acetohalobium arabaticum (strain ATCC 49924 / DSM 5501 / Z-7288) TaxID=574087 RepID=D9QTH9_ACEAZ|nr:energy-coupling factor transporter ATPase [Acetohalobium arabaticum]ADL11743.1 ABC transporter related protein [Acetohalobium arabaticum DSM 5501]
MFIELESVAHSYDDTDEKVLRDINFSISEGEFISLIGHTGSGKSTLVQLLNGLITPTEGRVIIDGDDITTENVDLKSIRRQVGLVFQYPEHQLFEETVGKDIAFGPKNLNLSDKEVNRRVKEALDSVGLDYDSFKDRSPFNLSGGQQRRVAIAGVLAMRPKVLILDEPTAGLDPKTRSELMDEIIKFKDEFGLTIILVSHRMEEVFQLADRILVLHQGRLAFDEAPEELANKYQQLEEIDLGVPKVTEVLVALQKCDYDLDSTLFNVQAAKEEIIKALRG